MNASVERKVDEKLHEFLKKLNRLDFGSLAYRLMNPEDRPGFSAEKTLDAIRKYKGFLFICYANKGKAVSPSRYVDYVWHTHIADTELYSVQSAALFGHYLHHFPFFGKRGEADEEALRAASESTRQQALAYFGWDEAGWCGTGRIKHWPPRLNSDLRELVKVLFPAGPDGHGMSQEGDAVTIQAGNFRHTVEYLPPYPVNPALRNWAALDWALEWAFFKIPIIVCMPAELELLDGAMRFAQEGSLLEIEEKLANERPSPNDYSAESVSLRLAD
ncbi:hypothetical protein H3V53_03485 [Paraburkholderia bengalensis]|uniref:Immunity protein 52 domain-containing protein n=1 Tax=Paraburkholderia bengalensis TaxID=2747562 RepID=A0ABU8ILA1_9BURK